MYEKDTRRKTIFISGEAWEKLWEQAQKPVGNHSEAVKAAKERLKKNGFHFD
jgi:hypothetical protein